ncbi:MAG: class I SAM-dependent methyltransferase [Paracoccaceae bacterium]
MSDEETLAVYDAKAGEYATCFSKGDHPDTQLRAFLDALPHAATVLDLGCGPGRTAGLMAAEGHAVTATDASAEMVKLATKWPGVLASQASFDDLTGDAIYDGIWANFSLLHAARGDLPRHFTAISKALKSGGVFHIGMKTGIGTDRDAIGRRYTYVTDVELRNLMHDVLLTPIANWTGRDAGLAGTVDPWIVIQARKDG